LDKVDTLSDPGSAEGTSPTASPAVREEIRALDQAFGAGGFEPRDCVEVRLGVGDIPVAVRMPAIPPLLEMAGELRERYRGFETSHEPRVTLWVLLKEDLQSEPFRVIEVHSIDGIHYALRFDFRSRLDIANGIGAMFLHPAAPFVAIDAFVRITYSFLAVHEGGLLMHASSVRSRDGRGFVFMGRSGAGKSTIAEILDGQADILTDEISLLRFDQREGKAVVHGTPFWGTLAKGRNLSAPAAAAFRLTKAPETRLNRLSANEAVSALMKNVLHFANGMADRTLVLDTCIQIQGNVPILDLHFEKNAAFWRPVLDYGQS